MPAELTHPGETTIPRLLGHRIRTAPEAVAVVCDGRSLTYRELDTRVHRLARALTAAGVGREAVVGLAVSRSADLVVALLGILHCGAAYLPLDPRYPGERLRTLLADAGPSLVLTDTASAGDLPATGAPYWCVDVLDLAPHPDGHRDADTDAHPPVHPDNAAYVMYTSGSTGTPKGVAITHANVVHGILRLAPLVGMRPGAKMLAGTSVNFDVSVFELLTALSTGATVEVVRDVLAIAERGRWSGTVLHTVPSVFAEVLDRFDPEIEVETAVFAGEGLPAWLVERVRRAVPGVRVINAYGQAESFYASMFVVPDGDPAEGNVPIGKPLEHIRAVVLDAMLTPVAPGRTGELYVGGMVGRGYYRRPGLTADRFVADPFGDQGARMYRTGDLARWNADGDLELLGRVDTQLKLRGVRIEAAEIESTLMRHPAVAHAVITLRHGGESRSARLVAHVVPDVSAGHDEDALRPRALRRFVADRLPEIMIPSEFVLIDRIPLTPNGKLDRAALNPGSG